MESAFSDLPWPDMPRPAFPVLERGHVWLVGAGPGDPGLLSLLGLHGLRQADTIVYDALVDERVLALATPSAALMFAGKRGGKPSPRQPDISRALIELAREGRRVLRLKGGDPFVFGRGAEEALALRDAGVPFRVVPGITAGLGGLAYAGIPATSRDTNAAITLITGHASTGEVPDGLNWSALAHGAPVIVLYMAVKHLPVICARLLAEGRPGDDPAAAVSCATTDRQQVVCGTLETLPELVTRAHLQAPAVIVIGPVVRLRERLDWLKALAESA